jgi:hypothetical protein
MSKPTIFIAHSKSKSGYHVRSYELWPAVDGRKLKSGWHIASDDTLEAATSRVMDAIRHDWQHLGEIPEIIDCGKQSRITVETYSFGVSK